MADISANITKSLQGLSNIPVGDLAAGIQQFADALAAGEQTIKDNNVTGRQYNQILKSQSDANAKFIKDEKRRFKESKRQYRQENTLWQRATKQNKEHLKAQGSMIKGMKIANRELTAYGRAQSKLMSGLQRTAGATGTGIAKLAGKAGALGLVVVALKTLVDKILEADQILVDMSKSTGQFRDALRPAADRASLVANQLAMAGVSMKEVTESSLGFLNNLTKTNRDYSKFLGTTTMVSKAFGIGAEQSSKFFATIAETTTITGENMEKMVDDIVAFGATGTNVARVMRDMTANSNLIAVYGGQQVENLIKMAKYAADSGTNLEGIRGTMEHLGSDFDTAISSIQELNVWFSTNIDAADAYQVAFRNNADDQAEWYKDTITQLARATKFGDKFNAKQLQVMKSLGFTPEQIRYRGLILKQQEEGLTVKEKADLKAVKQARKLRDLTREQQSIWQKLQTIIMGPLNVFLRNLGEFLEQNLSPILDDLSKTMDELFDGKKMKRQIESGDLSGALKTAITPAAKIMGDLFSAAIDKVFSHIGQKWKFNAWAILPYGGPVIVRDLRGGGYSNKDLEKLVMTGGYDEQQRALEEISSREGGTDTRWIRKRITDQDKLNKAQEKLNDLRHNGVEIARKAIDAENRLRKETDKKKKKAIKEEFETLNEQLRIAADELQRSADAAGTISGVTMADETRAKKLLEDGIEAQASAPMQLLIRLGKLLENKEKKEKAETKALGGFGGLSIVGEAGGEVVASRSALRSGIGIGGRAASALAGIGVPGFGNGFTSTYAADTSGTRESEHTWRSGRDIRGQFGAAASEAQNKPLREFQESVYQFRLSTIEYGEYMRSNIQQQRQLPFMLVQAIERGIQIVGHKLMGESGQKMFEFGKGNEALQYMNMFNKMGAKGTVQAIGQGFLGQFGLAAKGKYVNSPTLMMVGEENRGEIVVPTERIRRGLPINKDVENELASIGVPGFATGGYLSGEMGRNEVNILSEGVNKTVPELPIPGEMNVSTENSTQVLLSILKTNSNIAPQINSANNDIIGLLSENISVLFQNHLDAMLNKLNDFHAHTTKILTDIVEVGVHSAKVLQHQIKILEQINSNIQKANQDKGGGIDPAIIKIIASGAATGKYVNSPTLMMVGEEGRGEVVVPTERIRKGLPINAGVARELGSIGVPGFANGGKTSAAEQRRRANAAFEEAEVTAEILKEKGYLDKSGHGNVTLRGRDAVALDKAVKARIAASKSPSAKPTVSTTTPAGSDWMSNLNTELPKLSIKDIEDQANWAHGGTPTGGPIADDVFSMKAADATATGKAPGTPGFFGSNWGEGSDFAEAGGFSGVGRASLGVGAMQGLQSAFNVYQQGGTTEQIMTAGLSSALGAGVSFGASALLAPVLGPFAPIVGGFIGSQVGKFAGKWLGKKLGANDPKFGKYRKQAMQLMKTHVKNRMPFEPGIPHGLGKKMHMGIAGRFGKPTNKSQTDMRNALMKNFSNLSNREAIGFINMISGAESNPKAYAYFNKDFGLPQAMEFAEGGVVNKPTNAIIGEAGPEAVVPLENSELVKEMKEIRKATQQLVKIIGDGKTTINLDGRVLAESTGLNMYDIAQGM